MGLGLGYVAHDFLKVADNTERVKISLDQLTNGKGEEWFRKLNDWAFKMPVNTEKATEAFVRLKAFGIEPTIRQMTTLVDSTIGVGRGEEALESVSRALGQIQARGKLSAEELNQLAEAGISAKAMLADAFGVSVANLEKLIEKGIDSRVAVAALFDQLEARFGGASSKIQKVFSGLKDALISHWRDFQRLMMESGVMQAIEAGLGRIVAKLDELRSSGRIAEWADRAGKAIQGLINRAVNFIQDIINNWGAWEDRWDKFKSSASEYWQKTKEATSAIGSLFSTALNAWNSLPPVIREFGLIGALLGGVKMKMAFAAMMLLGSLGDKIKSITEDAKKQGGTGAQVAEGLEQLNNYGSLSLMGILNGLLNRYVINPLDASQAVGPMGGDMGGAMAQGLADLGIPELEPTPTVSTAGTTTTKSTPRRFTLPEVIDEKALAQREKAGLAAVKEYMSAVEEANKLEVSLRQQTMTSYEKSFDDLERGYLQSYDKIEDLEYKGAITSEQALEMRRQASSNYFATRDKMEAEHNQGLLRKIEEYGKSGRELQKIQLQHEIEDLQKAGYDKELIRQYTAQRMYEIDKSMLEKTLEAYTNTDQLIADGTKNLMDGLQQEWTGFFTKVFDNGLSNIEDSFGDFCDAVFNMWKQMLAQFVAHWTLSGFASIMLGLINLLKGGEFTINLTGGGSGGIGVGTVLNLASTAKSVWDVGSAVVGAMGVGAGMDAVLGALGLGASSYTGVTGALMASGPAATAAAEATLGAEVAAIYESLGLTSTATTASAATGAATAGTEMFANSAAMWDFGSSASLGTQGFSWGAAAGAAAPFAIWELGSLLSGGAIPSLTDVPGLIYEGIFGGGDSMSPAEAVKNWEGTLNYMTKASEQMKALGVDFDELQQGIGGSGFGLFGESAKEAAIALEHLHTVAGLSQAQVDALVASLDPLTQKFLASGKAANDLEGKTRALAQEMNAAINSFNMTSSATNEYNDRISALAKEMGLTGDAATAFRDKIWNLANSFSQGGEEAEYFDKALGDFVSGTLTGISEAANSACGTVGGLIDVMKDGTEVARSFTSSLPRGGGSSGSTSTSTSSSGGNSLGSIGSN